MSKTTKYSPKDVRVSWGDMTLTGLGTGGISVEPNTDTFSQTVGMKGDVVQVESADNSALATISFLPTSASLPQLRRDAQDGTKRTLTIRNVGDDTGYLMSAANCRISKKLPIKENSEPEDIEVTILIPNYNFK